MKSIGGREKGKRKRERRNAEGGPYHLSGQYGVQEKARQEAIQYQIVVYFLDGREYSSEGAEEVIEDLEGEKFITRQPIIIIIIIHPLQLTPSSIPEEKRGRKKERTHSKSTQLPRTSLPPNSHNLRHLTRHSHQAGQSLQALQRSHIHHVLILQHIRPHRQRTHKSSRERPPPLKRQDQQTDGHILRHDQRRLAIRAEREPVARAVEQRDQETGRLEHVGQKGDPHRGFGLQQFHDLRDFDNRGARDDGEAEGFGYAEFEAGDVAGEVEFEQEGFVAVGT